MIMNTILNKNFSLLLLSDGFRIGNPISSDVLLPIKIDSGYAVNKSRASCQKGLTHHANTW